MFHWLRRELLRKYFSAVHNHSECISRRLRITPRELLREYFLTIENKSAGESLQEYYATISSDTERISPDVLELFWEYYSTIRNHSISISRRSRITQREFLDDRESHRENYYWSISGRSRITPSLFLYCQESPWENQFKIYYATIDNHSKSSS